MILKILSLILISSTLFSYNIKMKEPVQIIPKEEIKIEEQNMSNNSFNQKLMNYIDETSLKNENYIFSPLSLKYALSMLGSGVSGEAKSEILNALNFSTEEEMLNNIKNIEENVKNITKPLEDKTQYLDNDIEKEIKLAKENYQNKLNEFENLKKQFKEITNIDIGEAKSIYELDEDTYEKYQNVFDKLNKNEQNKLGNINTEINRIAYQIDDAYAEILYLESIFKPIQLDIANSIWYNETVGQDRRPKTSFVEKLNKYFNSEYHSEKAENFSKNINEWVKQKTNNKIDSIATPNNDYETILALINAIYLKADWETEFRDFNTKEDEFTTIDNIKVKKELMFDTFSGIPYYEDENTQIIGLTFKGKGTMYFVLGDTTNIEEKIKQCKPEKEVHVTLPKYKIENTIHEEMFKIIEKLGIKKVFKEDHETFKDMFEKTNNIFVSDIIQKTYLNVQERGIEAAAVTAVMTCGITALEEEYKPKKFIANKPFSFYIYMDDENNKPTELMFFGQYVK